MPASITGLEAAFTKMEAEMTRTETVGAAIVTALNNQLAAIIAAVKADNDIDEANTARLTAIAEAVNGRMTANATALEAAATANTPQA